MPRMVDVDERRSELIEATCQVIARHGLNNVTLRSVARVRGWTTGIVSHYFADKRALLMATFESRADRARFHLEQRLLEGSPLLEAALDATLPLDEERMLDWKIFLAFMGASIGEPELAAVLHRRQATFRAVLLEALSAEVRAHRLASSVDPAHEADRLLVVINGVAMKAVLDPHEWPPSAQRMVLADHLDSLARSSAAERRRRTLVEGARRSARRNAEHR